MPLPVSIASESELIAIKNAGGPLKLFGYGKYGDNSEEEITFPKSFTGFYSELSAMYSNSAYMETSLGNACTGDSGGPILSITTEQITVIGIITGGSASNYCTKLQNGSSYALFTLINRYANLAFSSANYSIISISQLYSKTLGDLNLIKSLLTTATASLGVVSKKLEIAQVLIMNANSSNAILYSQLALAKKANFDLVAKIRKICSVKPKLR